MTLRRILCGFASVSIAMALMMVVPGCGGGGTETGADGTPVLAPVTNPAPGVSTDGTESESSEGAPPQG